MTGHDIATAVEPRVRQRPTITEGQAAGRAARDAGTALVEQHADPRVIAAIDLAIEDAIASGARYSANDIRDRFPVCDQHLVGARVRSYATRKVTLPDGSRGPMVVKVDQVQSSLVSTHAHLIGVWQRTDAVQPSLWWEAS